MTAASMEVSGPRRIISSTPANTNEATLLTAGEERPVIIQVMVTNLTGTAANATVKWGDGSTDYSIIDTYSVPARGFVVENFVIPLRETYTIKITSGTGSALTFSVVVVETAFQFGGEQRMVQPYKPDTAHFESTWLRNDKGRQHPGA